MSEKNNDTSVDVMHHNCTNCNYSRKTQLADAQGKSIVGKYQHNCLRMPPSAFMVPTPQGVTLGSAFPVVTDEQICSLYDSGDGSTSRYDELLALGKGAQKQH